MQSSVECPAHSSTHCYCVLQASLCYMYVCFHREGQPLQLNNGLQTSGAIRLTLLHSFCTSPYQAVMAD